MLKTYIGTALTVAGLIALGITTFYAALPTTPIATGAALCLASLVLCLGGVSLIGAPE